MSKKNKRYVIDLDEILRTVRIPVGKPGQTLSSRKGKGSYNRKRDKREWRREINK
jgi:hypothetical protein